MTVLKLMAIQLRQMGADGLCNDECGCELGDLAPCKNYMGDCVPAIAVKAWDEDGERETSYIPLESLKADNSQTKHVCEYWPICEESDTMTPLEREAIENFINYLRTLPRLAAYRISWFKWDANARFRFENPCDWHMFLDLQAIKLLSLNFDEIASYLIKHIDEYEQKMLDKQIGAS